jgi:hypothetical protein
MAGFGVAHSFEGSGALGSQFVRFGVRYGDDFGLLFPLLLQDRDGHSGGG